MTDRIGQMFGQLGLFSDGHLRPRLKVFKAEKQKKELAVKSPARSDSCEMYRGGATPKFGKGLCGKCGEPLDVKVYHAKRRSRRCKACHAAHMRASRKRNEMTPEQRLKDNARSKAGVYLRRGKIKREPCKACGAEKAQMHHHDYSKPYEVEWLCRPCHLAEHYAPESFRSHADGIQTSGNN